MLGPFFLREGEDTVEYHHHHEDRDAQLRQPGDECQPPATQKSSAKKWTISAARGRHHGVGCCTGRRFGPRSVNKRAA